MSSDNNGQVINFPAKIESRYEHLPANLSALFNIYLQVENDINRCVAMCCQSESEKKVDHLINVQRRVLELASRLNARTKKDLYHKLALWRRESPEISAPLDELKDYEAIAYSAFRDLARMLGKDDHLTNEDKSFVHG